jgi:hypothetical protein
VIDVGIALVHSCFEVGLSLCDTYCLWMHSFDPVSFVLV